MSEARTWRINVRFLSHPSFWAGVLLGGVCSVAAVMKLPFVDWQVIAAPVDSQPLLIRHDAKGDGHFASPRSGHRRHRGIDLVAPLNSPVHAIRSGTVVEIGIHRGLGQFIELEHRNQLHSLYAHLNAINVDVGEKIRQGQPIGTVGKTGNARHPWITPHLHLEVLKDGQPIDPQTLGLRVVDARTAVRESEVGPDESDASGGE